MKRKILSAIVLVAGLAGAVQAATCTYSGSWDITPSAPADVIVVSSGGNVTWSNAMPDTVASWTQDATYTNTVTFATVYGTSGFTNFTVTGDVTLNGGTWKHVVNTGGETNRLRVTVGGNLLITNATIAADALGYELKKGPGAGAVLSGIVYGGVYGGVAPGSDTDVNPNKPYGSVIAPTNLGSGGGGDNGGGAIQLTVAGTTTVASAGMVSANGGGTVGYGGGAGGSIYLTTGWLTGNGIIRANGAADPSGYGGGSGGRLAVILTGSGADFTSWNGTNTAYGGAGGSAPAAAGTVYLKTTAGADTLVIDNNNVATYGQQISTLMPNAVDLNSFSNVVISRKGVLAVKGDTVLDFNTFNPTVYGPANSYLEITSDTNVTYPADWTWTNYTVLGQGITKTLTNVTIATNGSLSHCANGAAEKYKLRLTIAGNLAVLSNGRLTADACGYFHAQGPGKGVTGGGYSEGGAYGGVAAGAAGAPNANRPYGSVIAPTNVGSGGGGYANNPYTGGPGGGAIQLTVAGTTTVAAAGSISANGGVNTTQGGGSGGSIYLNTGWLNGSGTIRADGGTSPDYSAGSGGRIALILTGSGADFSSWSGTNAACGGATVNASAAGTIYLKTAGSPPAAGQVIVSNRNATLAAVLTDLPPTNAGVSLNGSSWLVAGYGKVGATTNVYLDFLTITGANARVDLRGRRLSVLPDLNINGTLYGVGLYHTNDFAGNSVTDSVGGGSIEVRPAVDNAGGATNVTPTSAWLNGNLYVADASSTALFVLWGIQDAGTNLAQWAHTNLWPAPQSAGLFSTNVTAPDLQAAAVQYYRFYTTNNVRQNIASNSSAFMTAAATVQKTADAAEDGLVPGAFAFYREPAATNGPITVYYSIGGSARAGTNYVNNLGTSITFAAAATQMNLAVTPLQDDASTNNETIILTLTNGPYQIGSPSVATVMVANMGIPGAPTNTWIGSGNASQVTNWSLGHVPGNTEHVLLGGYSKAGVIWDVTNAIASWRQTDQYTGTVTIATVYGAAGFTNFTVTGDVTLSGGVWTHTGNAGTEANRLFVAVGGNLLVTNATVTADTRGYGSAQGPGKGVTGSGYSQGGAYGGVAMGTTTVPNPNRPYGSVVVPTNLGSGGANAPGGGAIQLTVAGTTTVASGGTISANGGTTGTLGAGSGGSIYLTTGWLNGNGTIRANGGTSPDYSAGSGGRVAIVLTGSGADFTSWNGTNTAYGGATLNASAAGTIYLKAKAGATTLIVDNNGTATWAGQVLTLMPNAVDLNSFSNVVINHKGVLGVKGDTVFDFNGFNLTIYGPSQSYLAIESDTNVTYPANWTIDGYTLYGNGITKILTNVTIGTNGVLSHYVNSGTVESYKLNLAIAGNLTVLSNGMISADAYGFSAGYGPGGGGSTLGGAYGGGASGNPYTYGSVTAPTNLGSGGGSGSGSQRPGGGAIQLTVAGTTTVASAGAITANGGSGFAYAGSGGSIYLTTGWLTGNGTIQANGGASPGWGDGGGGRVAIILTGLGADFIPWNGTNTAYGGATAIRAAAGTVYRKTADTDTGAGTVIVDNGATATNQAFTSLPAFSNSAERIIKTVWMTTNKARLGLLTNAAIEGLTLNANGVLELAGYTLTVRALTVTNRVYKNGIYGPHDTPISLLTDAGSNGKVVVNRSAGSLFVIH